MFTQAKAFDKKTSVLHYLVKLLRNEKSLLAFKEDILPVFEAQRISLDMTYEGIKNLSKEFEIVKTNVAKITEKNKNKKIIHRTQSVEIYDTSKNSRWDMSKMELFIEEAKIKMENCDREAKDVRLKYDELLVYFGEESTMKSEEFFGTIQAFSTAFDSAYEHVMAQEKAAVSIELFYANIFVLNV